MKAISLLQPWASLVVLGSKRTETRSWSTRYRGILAIHASAGFKRAERDLCCEVPFPEGLRNLRPADLPLGAIIGTCRLVACVRTDADEILNGHSDLVVDEADFGDYGPERYAWILDDVRRLLKPIPARGSLGIWNFDESGHSLLCVPAGCAL